jgi:chemotaxis protein methyltransferase WspC
MNRSEQILGKLEAELGFSAPLVGGKKTILSQIDRFLAREDVPDHLDAHAHPQLWSRLISEVVIPETSFFRYPESFSMLQEWARPRLHQSLRALCVPCSTGEEPYSIAIALREAGAVSFQITAFDASTKSVNKAQTGSYSIRSVRGLPESFQKQWFDESSDHLTVKESIREPITFEVANIFAIDVPTHRFDFIFCRNLLIYLDAEKQRVIFDRLSSWLKPDGLLLLGPGEATTAASHGWKSTGYPMSFSFVRTDTTSGTVRPRTATSRPILPRPTPRPAPRSRTPEAVISIPSEELIDWLARAAALADAGHLAPATQALASFHEHHEATAASYFLQGILEEAQDKHNAAEASYRKALYLDPDHLDALLHLSLLLEGEGRAPAAAPLRRRIERLSSLP